MKTLIIGDTHIREETKVLFELLICRLPQIFEEHKIDRVIFMGDVYNQRAVIRTEHQRLLIHSIKYLLKYDVSVSIVVGNHDMDALGNYEHNSLEILPMVLGDKVKVFNKFTVLGDEVFIPYTTDFEKLKKLLDVSAGKSFAYCHLPVRDFFMAPNHKDMNGVPREWFSAIKKRVYVGHYHAPQQIGHIIYPGATFVNSFSEAGVRPQLLIDDQESDTMESIDIAKLIPEMPLYYVFKVEHDSIELDDLPIEGNSVRFVINGPTIDDCKRAKHQILMATENKKCRLQFQYITERVVRERIADDISIKDMFLQYIEGSKEYKDNKEALTKMGVEYMDKVYATI